MSTLNGTASDVSSQKVQKTVLELDLVGYSDIALVLEENLDVEAVKIFQEQIQQFVDVGLGAVGLQREPTVIGTAGDNAILIFDDPETMHRFAHAVQNETEKYNSSKQIECKR
jgi:hypothetical protein